MTFLKPDDASFARAASRVITMVAQELDMLSFLAQQGKDEATDWLLTRSVKPRITPLLNNYRINIVFGLVEKDDAVTGLANYLRLQPWTDGCSESRHIRMWDMRGSHIVYAFYEGTEVKVAMEDASRIMLRHFDPVPSIARARLMRAIVQRHTATMRTLTDEALFYRATTDTRAIVEAALLVYTMGAR